MCIPKSVESRLIQCLSLIKITSFLEGDIQNIILDFSKALDMRNFLLRVEEREISRGIINGGANWLMQTLVPTYSAEMGSWA